jgi:hypothetical protein
MISRSFGDRRVQSLTCADPAVGVTRKGAENGAPRPRVSAVAPAGMRSVTVCLPDVLVTANTGESP